jgi:tetratricopeptide (TPR) repeat protein
VLIAYLTLACLAGIVLTGSRGGYLSTTAGIGVLVMMSFWSARSAMARPTLTLVVGIVVIVCIIGSVIAFVTERSFAINARANSVFVSTDIRLQLWDAALKQFHLAPVFGTGSRTYLYYGRMFRGPGVHTDPVFAHSDYLQTLAEYGAVGLALFAGFIAFHLRNGWRLWHALIASMARYRLPATEKNALALQIGCVAALAAYLVHSALDFNLHIPANALLIALVFGMLATGPATPAGAPPPRWAWMPAAIVPILGAWMIAVGAPKVAGELFVENARAKLVAGNPSEALEDIAHALEWGTRNPEVHYYIGEANRLISARSHDPFERFELLRAAHKGYADGLALFPQDVRLVLMTAWSLQRLDRLDEAATLLAQAARLDPNSGDVWIYHSIQEKLSGNPAEALAYYQKAASLGCDIPSVMRVLGERLDPQELQKAAARLQSAPAVEK